MGIHKSHFFSLTDIAKDLKYGFAQNYTSCLMWLIRGSTTRTVFLVYLIKTLLLFRLLVMTSYKRTPSWNGENHRNGSRTILCPGCLKQVVVRNVCYIGPVVFASFNAEQTDTIQQFTRSNLRLEPQELQCLRSPIHSHRRSRWSRLGSTISLNILNRLFLTLL